MRKAGLLIRHRPKKIIDQYVARIAYENEGMDAWQRKLMLDSGYIEGGQYTRDATVDASMFAVERKTQSVKKYEWFRTASPEVNVDAGGLYGVEKAQKTIDEWRIRIFGRGTEYIARETGSKADIENYKNLKKNLLDKAGDVGDNEKHIESLQSKVAELRGGEFGVHVGYAPILSEKLDPTKGRDANIESAGSGQVGIIMLSWMWNDVMLQYGVGELSKAPYDKKLWPAGGLIEPPSLRQLTNIALEIVGTATGHKWLGILDDALFGTFDLAVQYKSPLEVALDMGKAGASMALSYGMSKAGEAVGGVIDKVAGNAFLKGLGNAAWSAGSSYMTGVANSYMNALHVDENGRLAMDWAEANKSWYSKDTFTSLATSSVGSFVSGTMRGFNMFDGNNIILDGKTFDVSNMSRLNNLAGGLASSAVSFAMTGNATFNVASIMGTGFLEVTVGKDGVSSRFGTGGTNVSIGTLVAAARGLAESSQVLDWKYGGAESRSTLNAINMLSHSHDAKTNKNAMNSSLARDIWRGRKNVQFADLGENEYGNYKQGETKITLNENLLGAGREQSAKMASVLAHEGTHAYGNRIEGIAHLQAANTYSALLDMFGLNGDATFAGEMLYGVLDKDNWKENVGDTDYWKLTWGGQLVNDKQGWLKDENGMYINADGSRTSEVTDQTLGANGIETGLLNIVAGTSGQTYDMFTEEQISVVQKLMLDSGMAMDDNGFWTHNKKGQVLNMYDFMSIAGADISDVIFNAYYNNTVDSMIANAFGLDLGFTKNHAVPPELYGKWGRLVTQRMNDYGAPEEIPERLREKYKFTVTNSDGTSEEFFKIDKNNPFIDDLLGQHSYGLNTEIDESGCNFMSTIAYPQLLTGKVFNSEQVIDIWNSATALEYVGSDAYVSDPDKLTDLVWNNMYMQHKSRFGWKPFPSMKYIGNISVINDGKHYVVGSIDNNIIYNPGWTVGSYRTVPVYFKTK